MVGAGEVGLNEALASNRCVIHIDVELQEDGCQEQEGGSQVASTLCSHGGVEGVCGRHEPVDLL